MLALACSLSATCFSYASEEPSLNEELNPNEYNIVSPVPLGSSIEQISQAQRLDTLTGKKIALVGGSFSASVTHKVIADMLVSNFGCTVYYTTDDIGKSGTFNPNNPSDLSKAFQNKLKEYEIDAVISGNCGCGICTVKETGNALAAEYIGIPAVVVGAESFIAQIESTGYNRGVPVVRTAKYPGAFASDTTAEQQSKAAEKLYGQIVTALTTQITEDEITRIAGAVTSASYNDVIFTGTFERVQHFFEASEMTDGMTVVPPTQQLIDYYLQFTPYEATDIVNKVGDIVQNVPPANKEILAYQVAANAIMAGCPPEFMPLCIAIVRCFGNGNFYKSLSSTHGWTPYVLVSGPIARQLGFSSGSGMINENANKQLGRFVSLAMQNLAGYKIKENRMGTFGYIQPFVFAEDEEACQNIGWNPYHVNQGYEIDQNVVTCGSTLTWGNSVKIGTDDPEKALELLAWDVTEKQQNALGNTNPREARMVLLTKDAAALLAKAAGCSTKNGLTTKLIDIARRPLWMRTYAHYWANTGSKIHLNTSFDDFYNSLKEGASTENIAADIVKETAAPEWFGNIIPFDKIDTTQTIEKNNTNFVITGGDTGCQFQILPGGDCCSFRVRLPNNWDKLLSTEHPTSDDIVMPMKAGQLPIDFDGSYDELNAAEDAYDLIEPTYDYYSIVSPSNSRDTGNTIILQGNYEYLKGELQRLEMTDGLPVILPTKIKVEKYMRYTQYKDNDVVANISGRNVTAYQVVVNAVMAGCEPAYVPICMAFAEALDDSDYLNSISSGEKVPFMYVNGPIARQIGIDNKQGMTTEECNTSIARFMELALINLAGINRTNAFGTIQPLVFSENDEACARIGWDPSHVEKGYAINDNVITAGSFSMWGNNLTPATDIPEEIMKVMAWDITEKNLGGLGGASISENAETKRLIFITESVAEALSEEYKTKANLESALVNNARRPLAMRAYAYMYMNDNSKKTYEDVYNELKASSSEDAKETPSPAWMEGITYPEIETVATMIKDNSTIIVTGDSSRNKTQVMPGGVMVSKKVKPSELYDALVTSVGYNAIQSYNITFNENIIGIPSTIPSELTDGSYRILVDDTYLSREGRLYYDSTSKTLHYYANGGSARESTILDSNTYAEFIGFISSLGYNSSFNVQNGKITSIIIRFSSNSQKLISNLINLSKKSFTNGSITIHANNTSTSNEAGGIAKDGAMIKLPSEVRNFTLNLEGEIEMGSTTNKEFVKIDGNSVTVNPNVKYGATAVIGTPNGDGTYRTITFFNQADGSYTITYHTSSQLQINPSIMSGSLSENVITVHINITDTVPMIIAGYGKNGKLMEVYSSVAQDGELTLEVNSNSSNLSWKAFLIDASFKPQSKDFLIQ